MMQSSNKSVLKRRIYDFPTSLNFKFNAVRIQILGKEDFPSLNEVIVIVCVEEGMRGGMKGGMRGQSHIKCILPHKS